MRSLIKKILKEQLNPIKWIKPDFHREEEEIMNHFLGWLEDIYEINTDEEYHQLITDIHYTYADANVEVLTDEEWSQLENTDSWGLETEEDIYDIVGGYGRSKERILKHSLEPIRNGGVVETPIVAYVEDYPPYLIAGNTRLSACKVLGVTPMVTKVYI